MGSNIRGVGIALQRNGNDGFVSVTEDQEGRIDVLVNGNLAAIERLSIMVNGREVVVPDAA